MCYLINQFCNDLCRGWFCSVLISAHAIQIKNSFVLFANVNTVLYKKKGNRHLRSNNTLKIKDISHKKHLNITISDTVLQICSIFNFHALSKQICCWHWECNEKFHLLYKIIITNCFGLCYLVSIAGRLYVTCELNWWRIIIDVKRSVLNEWITHIHWFAYFAASKTFRFINSIIHYRWTI